MSEHQATGPKRPLTGYLWVAALAALVGYAAVYFTGRIADNAGVPPAGQGAPAKVHVPDGSEIATFVRKSPPEPLPALTFQDGDGKPLTIGDFKGKTVLLNLWATWCAPCRHEMPALDQLQKELGSDKFEVVALSLDKNGHDKAKKFLAEIKAENLKFYIDPTGKEGFNLKPLGLPTTYLIDAEGREIGRLTGPAVWDSEAAKALIKPEIK